MAVCGLALVQQRSSRCLLDRFEPYGAVTAPEEARPGGCRRCGGRLRHRARHRRRYRSPPAPKPPPNPTNAQLAQASIQKALLAHTVGVLSAEIARPRPSCTRWPPRPSWPSRSSRWRSASCNEAKEQAATARATVLAAQQSIDQRQAQPDQLRARQLRLAAGRLDHDRVAHRQRPDRAAAGWHLPAVRLRTSPGRDGRAGPGHHRQVQCRRPGQTAEQLQQKLTEAAAQAQRAAQQAYAAEQAQTAQLQAAQASFQTQLAAAQLQLATLNNQRAKFLAYQRQQAAIAAAKARRPPLPGSAPPRRRPRPPRATAGQQRRSSGGSAAAAWRDSRPARSGWQLDGGQGPASRAEGDEPARRALRLGRRRLYGPTYGVDSPGTDGWNDANVFGFDCSGLTMFGWSPALCMPHFAASQYYSAGSTTRARRVHARRPAVLVRRRQRMPSTTSRSTSAAATWCRRRTPATWSR